MAEFSFRQCNFDDLDEVVALEAEVADAVGNLALLRRNSREMFASCLSSPHYAVGAWVGERLVAFAIMYVPIDGDPEDLAPLMEKPTGLPSANYKLVVVKPSFRGHKLQCRLGAMIEIEALGRGIRQLCATVSPLNSPSLHNLLSMGFIRDREVVKYGYPRLLMVRRLG
ncbi:MAG: hypothetical protein K6F85_03265 [Bacteroidales bacterium]|nr:hypothetical protein [Bacteroidales bacterium]